MVNYLTLNIGPSNSGKTRAGILPQLYEAIKENRSFVALDSKNILLPNIGNMLVQNGYNIFTFDIRNTARSHIWNPLYYPYQLYDNEKEKCYQVLNDLASDIFINSNDFWESSAKDLFVGLCVLLFNEATNVNQINLRSIYYLALTAFQKFASSNYIQEYLNLKDERFSLLAASIQTTSTAASETRQGILSTFYQSLRAFTVNDTIVNILSGNDICIKDVIKEKTALFLNYEDENPNNARILNVFIMQIYRTLITKQSQDSSANMYYSFFFDDFLSLPKFTRLDELLLGYKNRQITISFSINNFELLKKIYGEETMAALLSNADCINIFYDIMRGYDKYFTNSDYQGALSTISIDKMLRITLNNIENIDIKSIMINCDKEKLYNYNYQRQRNEEISYYNFEEFVKQMKHDNYKKKIEKLSGDLEDKSNLSLDMLLDLLKNFSA